MTDFTVTNFSVDPHVQGGPGDDSLTAIFEGVGTGGVWLDNVVAEGAGSYSGRFNGPGANDILFSGIERFGFDDRSGGDDIIRTFEGNDTLNGGGGNDLLHGGAGVDRIDGGEGVDRAGVDLSAATAGITLNLNGTSRFLGSGMIRNVEGFHDLRTGSGNDRITGHRSAAVADGIRTGAGNDRITLWMGGTDTVDGGAGTDTLIVTYAVATNGVWLDNVVAEGGGSYSGRFNGMGSNDLLFAGIERFSFTDRSGGDDIIRTFEGNDTLNGGGGNDLLHGGAGVDRIDGGAGVDRAGVDLSAVAAAVTIDLNTVSTFLGTGRMANVEGFHDLRTGSGADVITGHRTAAVADEIRTGAGNDRITLWMGGTDTVDGGAGTDTLVVVYDVPTNGVWLDEVAAEGGGSYSGRFNGLGATDLVFAGIERFSFTDRSGGDDIIRGFDGADTIEGGGGSDVMAGGGGRDTFVFNLGVNEGADRIEDFQNGLDRIRLAGGSFADVQVAAVNDGADTRLTFTGGTTVLLQGVNAGLVDAGDFVFV